MILQTRADCIEKSNNCEFVAVWIRGMSSDPREGRFKSLNAHVFTVPCAHVSASRGSRPLVFVISGIPTCQAVTSGWLKTAFRTMKKSPDQEGRKVNSAEGQEIWRSSGRRRQGATCQTAESRPDLYPKVAQCPGIPVSTFKQPNARVQLWNWKLQAGPFYEKFHEVR